MESPSSNQRYGGRVFGRQEIERVRELIRAHPEASGRTQGRGQLGDHRLGQVAVKTVWLYPLADDLRTQLSR